jgi:hypothetical protein
MISALGVGVLPEGAVTDGVVTDGLKTIGASPLLFPMEQFEQPEPQPELQQSSPQHPASNALDKTKATPKHRNNARIMLLSPLPQHQFSEVPESCAILPAMQLLNQKINRAERKTPPCN